MEENASKCPVISNANAKKGGKENIVKNAFVNAKPRERNQIARIDKKRF